MVATLEVVVRSEQDAINADSGGADRLILIGDYSGEGRSAEPMKLARLREVTDLPIRPLVRLREGYRTDGGEVTRLKGLIAHYLELGAEGIVIGFLNGYSQPDEEVLHALVDDERGLRFTFDRAIDRCLDYQSAWNVLDEFDGCDRVITAGSMRNLDAGLDELIALSTQGHRPTIVAADAEATHVVWLKRAGITNCQLSYQVRPTRHFDCDVDAQLVRTWRILAQG